ncbi:MAG TPA: hypothetical protein VEY88_04920 [Archangium sp.]|nr:hypothetical protein [Archangium sp.]
MRSLGTWWLTQASIDIVKDEELLGLMEQSGCIGIFLGIESLEAEDLRSVDKRQNKVDTYRDAIQRLHDRGTEPGGVAGGPSADVARGLQPGQRGGAALWEPSPGEVWLGLLARGRLAASALLYFSHVH